MKFKVSVIIPIYNSGKYLRSCVESLMSQTLQEVEYIFVNDASTDNSLSILENILKQHPNRHTRIIRLDKNGGIANARNIGLSNAVGEYITHCDSDDWIEPETYEKLYLLASDNKADIAACNFVKEYEDKVVYHSQHYSSNIQENIKRLLNGEIFPSLWSSIIKRELIFYHKIIFPYNLNMGEDLIFNVKSYFYANKIVYTDIPYYHYRHNGNSASSRRSKASIDSDISIAGLIEDFFISEGEYQIYKQEICYRKFYSKLALVRDFDNITYYHQWLRIYPDSNKYILSYKNIELKLRIMLWLASKHLFVVSKFIKHFLDWQHTLLH